MRTYDFCLQGNEATLENAIEHARGQDWQAMEQTDNDSLPHLDYKDTVNGVEIWYCPVSDMYLFTEEEDEVITKREDNYFF